MSQFSDWKLIDGRPRRCRKCGRYRGYQEREAPGKRGDTSWRLDPCGCGEPGDAGDERGGPQVDTGGRMGGAR
jgi:hypothetical protein